MAPDELYHDPFDILSTAHVGYFGRNFWREKLSALYVFFVLAYDDSGGNAGISDKLSLLCTYQARLSSNYPRSKLLQKCHADSAGSYTFWKSGDVDKYTGDLADAFGL